MSKLKVRKNLPVHIVEPHNDVVPFLHRAIASRLLPYSGIAMVHFDSHPDLLIPINLQADVVFKPQLLYESISIENWLLPLTYAKHCDHIVWVKPPWAHQINTAEQTFSIGKCTATGKLRLSSKENYFLTEALFCPAQGLAESSDVKLTVVELLPDKWADLDAQNIFPDNICAAENNQGDNEEEESVKPLTRNQRQVTQLQDIVSNKPYVLDVDLDFFSTANPFKNMLRQDEEQALRRLYRYPTVIDFSDENIVAFTERRETQINQLENVFSHLETKWFEDKTSDPESQLQSCSSLADFTGTSMEEFAFLDSQQQADLSFLCRSCLQHRAERNVTFIMLHYFGCTLDDTELPHHISTSEQVKALQASFRDLLEHLPKPTVVTIARSSDDGYCPKDVVDQYQIDVLKILEDLYGPLQINKHYE
ncbi:hypothetical protein BsWGS_22636 [Bradybaena similaris]